MSHEEHDDERRRKELEEAGIYPIQSGKCHYCDSPTRVKITDSSGEGRWVCFSHFLIHGPSSWALARNKGFWLWGAAAVLALVGTLYILPSFGVDADDVAGVNEKGS